MVSTPDHRKSMRFEHKSIVMLANERSEYFSYAQMFNFSGGGGRKVHSNNKNTFGDNKPISE